MQKSIVRNFLFKFILNIFNIVIPVLVGPYLARKLGPDQMGIFNYSQTIFTYFFIFASFGVYQYGIRELSNVKNNRNRFQRVFTSIFLISTITNILTLIIYYIFICFSKNKILFIPCMILSFNFFSNIFYVEWVNEALENFDFISIKTIIVKSIYIILIFLAVKSSNDLNQYMIVLGLTTFLNNILSYIYIKRKVKFDFCELKFLKHIKSMFMIVILSNTAVLYTQLDKLMIGNFINMDAVAFYNIAQQISMMISGLMLTFINVTVPRLTNYSANKENDKYENLLSNISKIYFMFLFPICIGMFTLSKQIILLYGGNQYVDAIPIFSIFSIYVITLGYESILTNQILYIKGKERELVVIGLIGGVINLIMNVLLVKFNILEPKMFIFTTMVSNILVVLFQNYYVKKYFEINFNIFSLDKLKYLFISLIFIPISLFIKNLNLNIILTCLFIVILNSSLYFLILYVLKDDVFNEILKKFKSKIKFKR
ncbi:flippase [Clostridium perfringens]|uniref:flippase n=1 Tax=Clostridium perfringens TaxID=1502 RepID=UPI001A2DA0BE|nr:flippase [Clostridium perfringens]EHR0217393.1 flippase [Clostridium perfringens]EHR0219742.1 flippase [Clostridium perfringens]EJT6159588.1 flippase [Clostridium perfringens]EJT6160623.1 flippase [Clostridium perfringens]MDN4557321.1 flippase [Clostridium perfringens]